MSPARTAGADLPRCPSSSDVFRRREKSREFNQGRDAHVALVAQERTAGSVRQSAGRPGAPRRPPAAGSRFPQRARAAALALRPASSARRISARPHVGRGVADSAEKRRTVPRVMWTGPRVKAGSRVKASGLSGRAIAGRIRRWPIPRLDVSVSRGVRRGAIPADRRRSAVRDPSLCLRLSRGPDALRKPLFIEGSETVEPNIRQIRETLRHAEDKEGGGYVPMATVGSPRSAL